MIVSGWQFNLFVFRCEKFDYSDSSDNSKMTITPRSIQGMERDNRNIDQDNLYQNIQIPIVGYEVMEERARFTVSFLFFVLRILK